MDMGIGGAAILGVYARLQPALEVAGFVPARLIAEYPRIVEQIDRCWDTPECGTYLDSLLFSERSGRQGFDEGLVVEILRIKDLHDQSLPHPAETGFDPFAARVVPSAADPLLQRSKAKPTVPAVRAPRRKGPRAAGAAAGKASRWPMVASTIQLRECLAPAAYGASLRDRRRLGEILVDVGAVRQVDVDKAVALQERQGRQGGRRESIGKILTNDGTLRTQDLVWGLCAQGGIPIVDLAHLQPPAEAIRKLSPALMRERRVLPLMIANNVLAIAAADPFRADVWECLTAASGCTLRPVAADAAWLDRLIEAGGQSGSAQTDDEFRALANRTLESFSGATSAGADFVANVGAESSLSENDATIIGLVNKFIADAIRVGASDIHVEGYPPDESQLRIRRDGIMQRYSTFPWAYHRAVVSRIKIMSDLDIAERRRPQDGKISIRAGKGRIDLRVAVIPTLRGVENVSLRILQSGDPLPLEQIGMSPDVLQAFRNDLNKPFGLILVCGPTGSGKTTTLHSALAEINTPERKIWTAEDPVEIVQKNINQVQVNARIGCDFSHILRAFLRADPDVIVVGEMRDQETAKIAVEASMTGHLVLSTLHTNSASETVARLLDLGVDPFSFSDALSMVLAQRLARRLCPDCAEFDAAGTDELRELFAEYWASSQPRPPSNADRDKMIATWREEFGDSGVIHLGRPVGCESCGDTGYRGRLGLHELLIANSEIRARIRRRAPAHEMLAQAAAQGMRTLKQDGIEKVLAGLTDLTQVRAACI